MSNKENIREKPSGENSSQQNSTQSSQDKPQSYGTVPVQKELNRSKPTTYGTVSRSYAEDTKNNVTIEQPLKEDN